MSEHKNNNSRRDKLEFFGKITAGVSHEINNVFSIINENVGLLSDWSEKVKEGKNIEPEKMARVTDSVRKQIGRGQDIVKQLNKFSHSVDEPTAEVELGEVLENMAYLSHRHLRRKALKLDVDSPKKGIRVSTDPFVLRHVIFDVVNLYLKNSEENSTISIRADKKKSVPFIEFTGGTLPADGDMREEIELLKSLAGELKAEMEINSPEGTFRLKLGESRKA